MGYMAFRGVLGMEIGSCKKVSILLSNNCVIDVFLFRQEVCEDLFSLSLDPPPQLSLVLGVMVFGSYFL